MISELERHRLHVARSPLAYILLDAEHRILDWNPAAERIFGYSREEALGRVCLDLLVPQPMDERLLGIIRRIEAGDMEAHLVNDNRTKDGRIITCAWSNTPLIDADGRFVGVVALAQDITETTRAHDAARQLAAIVESCQDGIIGKTLQGIMVNWNRGAERIFGYGAQEVIGHSMARLFPPHRDHDLPHLLAAVQQEITIEQHETVMKTKEGRLIEVALTISPIRDASGVICGASTMVRDVTQQHQTQTRIRENELLFEQIATNIDGYLWINTPDDSQMHYMSPGYEKITGRSRAPLYERPESWSEIIHTEDAARVLAVAGQTIGVGGRQVEYRIVRADGAVRWIRDRAFPVRNASGEIYRVAGLGEDITEQKRAADRIARARDFYLTLLDTFPNPIWRSGLDGKCDYFNQTWLDFTGRTREQEMGDGWAAGVHPEDIGECLQQYRAAFAARQPFELTYRLRRKDGTYRWIVDFGRPFNDLEGEFAGYIGSCYDITDQRQAIDQLREYNERVQALSHRLLEVREEERGSLACELHDGIAQSLIVMGAAFEDAIAAAPTDRAAKVNAARTWLEKTLQEVRELSQRLRPGALDHLGLVAALLGLVEQYKTQANLAIDFRHEAGNRRFGRQVETVAYRLVEEALSQAAHAGAKDVAVRIWVQSDSLQVQIENDSFAFEKKPAARESLYLAGIREQIQLLGGTLAMHSAPEEGTQVMAQLPINSKTQG